MFYDLIFINYFLTSYLLLIACIILITITIGNNRIGLLQIIELANYILKNQNYFLN